MNSDRRGYLRCLGGLCTAGVAGCLGVDTPTADATPTRTGTPERTLFVGNSYTARNGLPETCRSVLLDAIPTVPVRARSVTAGGHRLSEHVDDVESGSRLARLLAADEAPNWDAVVVQEQSQTPGFRRRNPAVQRSLDAVADLADLAGSHGGALVPLMTWGRRTGDDRNPELYPDFRTMQSRLADGYRRLAARARETGAEVSVAPVGVAFREVYEAVRSEGVSTVQRGTAFWDLYAADGSHPAPAGTYLAALVVAGTVRSVDPTAVSYVPDTVDPARAPTLRRAASRALDGWSARGRPSASRA